MKQKDRRDVVRFLAVVAVAVGAFLLYRPNPPAATTRTLVPIPEAEALDPAGGFFDVAPDGRLLVYRTRDDAGIAHLSVLPLGGAEARPLRLQGTAGADAPAVSPDGSEVAFVAGDGVTGALRVAPLDGGPVRTVVEEALPLGARWGPDGRWLYYTDADRGLSRVEAAGGASEVLTTADTIGGGEVHWGGEPLPGGRAVAYTSTLPGVDEPRLEVLDLVTGEVGDLGAGRGLRVVGPDRVVFLDGADPTLRVAVLDTGTLRIVGAGDVAATGVARIGDRPLLAADRGGRVWYGRPRGGPVVTPVWVDRDGVAEPIEEGWTIRGHPTYSSVALSPGGDRLAFSTPGEDGRWDLWLKGLSGDGAPPVRVTDEGAFNYRPTWAPDGRSLTFVSDRAGQPDLWSQPAEAGARAERVLDRPGVVRNGFRTPDGAWIVFREGEAPVADIRALAPETGAEHPLVATADGERSPALSPDGRWLAYTSNEGGRWSVRVTDFAAAGPGTWTVSPEGGEEPVWASAVSRLFYRSSANALVEVRIADGPAFEVVERRELFSMEAYLGSDGRAQYDVRADGDRFVMLRLEEGGAVEIVRMEGLLESMRAGMITAGAVRAAALRRAP